MPEPAPRASLTDELHGLLAHAAGRPVAVAVALRHLRERGPAAVMVLLTLPCVVPVLAAGLAIPVGFGVALYGLRLVLRQPPWVPGVLANRTLSFATLERLIGFADRWCRPVERLLRPRMAFMHRPAVDVIVGLALAFLGVFLALPLFVPGSNELPAAVIVLLLLGLIERDGVFVVVGLALTLAVAAAAVYLGVLIERYGLEGALRLVRHAREHSPTTGR